MSFFSGFGTTAASAAPTFGNTTAPAFGTAPVQPFGTSTFGAPATTSASTFGNTPNMTAAKPTGFGFGTMSSGFGNPVTTTTASSSFFSSSLSNPTFGTSSFSSQPQPAGTFQFPVKGGNVAAANPAAQGGPSTSAATTNPAKAGFTGTKPKDNAVTELLLSDIFALEKTIRQYLDIQRDAESYTMEDAVQWDLEMKNFDLRATKVQNSIADISASVDFLRKQTARLRTYNMLSNKLFVSPSSYYNVASSVESYFIEIISGLQTEIEILDDELRNLESLHDDLLRSNDRHGPLDLQAAYMALTKIVTGVAVAVDEVNKIGDELRKEIQIIKGYPPSIPAPQQPFFGQDIPQLMSTRSLFGNVTAVASPSLQHLTAQSKSPLLQHITPDVQTAMFNPAMRSLMRMDSTSTPTKSPPPRPSTGLTTPSMLMQGSSFSPLTSNGFKYF